MYNNDVIMMMVLILMMSGDSVSVTQFFHRSFLPQDYSEIVALVRVEETCAVDEQLSVCDTCNL